LGPDANAEFATFEQGLNVMWHGVKAETSAVRNLAQAFAQTDTHLKKSARQEDVILATAKSLYSNPLAIPYGGKAAIKKCCQQDPRLFSENSFDEAWKSLRRKGQVQMADHDKFSSRS
jgi:hypothetical protein